MATILVVDDEPSLITLLSYNLEKAGFDVVSAYDGFEALTILTEQTIDLVLLDVMLPGKSGIEVTRELRANQNHVPIIMITALDDEIDKIVGLEIGADDYITKPFSPREVVARIRAVLRRYIVGQRQVDEKWSTLNDHSVSFGNIMIDLNKMVVMRDKKIIKLTPKEYELLTYMVQRKNRVLDRNTILHGVWGFDKVVSDTRMVDIHLSHLREKIEVDPKHPHYLKTVRGLGYRFEGEV